MTHVAQPSMEEILRRANPVHESASIRSGVPLVVANRLVSAGFDPDGFQQRPHDGTTVLAYDSRTLLHFRAHVADATPIEALRDHRQELDLLSATLTTVYEFAGLSRLVAYAPRDIANLFVMRVERRPENAAKVLHFEIEAETSGIGHDGARLIEPVGPTFAERADGSVEVASGATRWFVHCPGAKLEVRGTHVHVRFDVGADGWARHTLKVLIHRGGCPGEEVLARSHDELHAAHAGAWRRWWQAAWSARGDRDADVG